MTWNTIINLVILKKMEWKDCHQQRLWLWQEWVSRWLVKTGDFDVSAFYWKAIGKSWESRVDLCLASREHLEMKSGADCVPAACQNVLYMKSSQDTVIKKKKTQNNGTRFLEFLFAISHLYSPNVPSSSFMGWISGSWCASSFSFTADRTYFCLLQLLLFF